MSAALYEIRDAFTGEQIEECGDVRPTRARIINAARFSDTGAAACYRLAGDDWGERFVAGYEDDGTPLR
jgi:hypothetical protein